MINIIPISDYFAVNIQRDSYIPMTEAEVQSCLHSDLTTKLCELRGPVYHMQNDQNLCIKNHSTDQCLTNINSCKNSWNALNTINTYLFFCCEQCTLRFICGNQVTSERVSKAGVLSVGNNCVLKGDAFIIYPHNYHINTMHAHPDLLAIDIPPINNIINLTIPISKGEISQPEERERQASLKEIGRQIDQMKKEIIDVEVNQLSTHNLHHYVVSYMLVGAFGAAGVAVLWKRVRQARRRSLAPAARPEPAPRLSLQDIPRACTSDSVSANQNISVQSARVQNKGTSPVFARVCLKDIQVK